MNENIDYKALYEELKAKMDKIEYEEIKADIVKRLQLRLAFESPAHGENLRKLLKANKLISLLGHHRLNDEERNEVVNHYGYDLVVNVIKEYVEELDKETEEEK